MLKSYLKLAFRYLAKHKGYTAINVLGLSVGIACCILIMLFVKSEWSFDRFHSNSDRIYRAWVEEHYQGEIFRNTVTPIPLGPVLQQGLPEAESTCRVGSLTPTIKYNNTSFTDPVTIVDSSFFNLFNFEFEDGSKQTAFPMKNSMVITSSAAKKYFGNENPIGKQLELTLGNDQVLFTITSVAKDPPLESSLQFEMLIPFSNGVHIWSEDMRTKAWSNVSVQTFVQLKKDASSSVADSKIASIMNPLVSESYKPGEYLVRLQPLKDIHFNSTLPEEIAKPSDPKYSYILSTIAILVLLIACINFVTLAIGRSSARALEVGVRKVLGAERQQLIRQFWGEALLLTLMALLLGLGLAAVLQKPFNQLANRELALVMNGFTIFFCAMLVILIGLMAGVYPAFVLSGFKPIEVLKGRLKTGYNINLFRKALIVGQFVASIVMIIATFSVGKQLTYLRSKDLGYDKEHIVVVSTNKPRREGFPLAQRFKTALEKMPDVTAVTTSLYSMAEYGWMNLGYVDEKKAFRSFKFNAVDADFTNAMHLQVIAGRPFSKTNTADTNYVLVNEA